MGPVDRDRVAAAGRLFDEHHTAVWRLLCRLAGSTVADDLAAEVFCVALDRFGSFDASLGSERGWLFGIAVNVVRTHHRGVDRESRAVQRLAARPTAPGLGTGSQVVSAVTREEQRAAVRDAVAALSESQREVVVLVLWEELSYEAAAMVLGIPLGTVRSRLARARSALQEALAAAKDGSSG
ncbi:MAG: RNA polymerase sigma factor [Acidimicrobiales bacterium]